MRWADEVAGLPAHWLAAFGHRVRWLVRLARFVFGRVLKKFFKLFLPTYCAVRCARVPLSYQIHQTRKMKDFQIGQLVHATKMGSDSFYLEVKGTVAGIKNGFLEINATEVKDRWGKKWEPHPTSCSTSCKIENAILIQ